MTFEDYEAAAIKTAVYPGQGSALGLIYAALKMNGEAGEFAEHVGKAIRDDQYMTPYYEYNEHDDEEYFVAPIDKTLIPSRHNLLIKELGDVLWYVATAARELHTDLATVAQVNIDKLAKRKAEGKLGGSGDNR